MRRVAFTLVELLVCIAIIVILVGFLEPSGRGLVFCFGWIAGIGRLVKGLAHEPVAVSVGVIGMILLPILLHWFLYRLPTPKFQSWRFRQSVAVVGIGCALIVATISMIALIHELYWFSHPAKPMSINIANSFATSNHLKNIVLAAQQYSDKNSLTFPPGGTILENGKPGHGWMTQLLPYLEQESLYRKIDMQKPWDDPVNATVFKIKTADVLRTASWRVPKEKYRNVEGYALTDFAANERVLPFGRSLKISEITDGTSNTIFCGEVRENFKPWGSPFNARDPSIGLNTSPNGFGSNRDYKDTVQFAFCDGSVQRISANIAPQILYAISTPNGGEPKQEIP